MTGMIYWVYLLIFTFFYILLSFLKKKNTFLVYITIYCILTFIFTIWLFIEKLEKVKIRDFNVFTKSLINSEEKITKKDKIKLLNFKSNNWKVNRENMTKAKRKAWLYDFWYCKKTKSDECYLEFIRWEVGLDWYENFPKKYNFFIKKYWQDIKKEIIFQWLKNDLLEEIKNWIKISRNIEIYLDNEKIILKSWQSNFFELKNKKTIDEKRVYIKNILKKFKNNSLNDLIYTEKLWIRTIITDWIKNVKITWSTIKVIFKGQLEFNIEISIWDILYITYFIDYKKYLSDEKYKQDFFENFKIIFYYLR